MTGALCFGAIVAAALLIGLGERPSRFAKADEQAPQAANAAPETLRELPTSYDAGDLATAADEQTLESRLFDDREPSPEQALTLPADSPWREPPRGEPGAPSAQAPASILYRRGTPRTEPEGSVGDAAPSVSAAASQFVILAGSVLPAALVTGLNSDLPGEVVAQVTAPVFDSVTGSRLLVPQGGASHRLVPVASCAWRTATLSYLGTPHHA
jgi:type IV secretion system protein VirB10